MRRSSLLLLLATSCSGVDGDSAPSEAPSNVSLAEAPLSTPPKALLPEGFYPRAIQRPDGTIIASVVGRQASGRLGATILESNDDGLSFNVVGHIDDSRAQKGICCGTLYQLPKAVGALPAGALLWSASVGIDAPNQPMSIPIWSSVDTGRSWRFLSNLVVGSVPRDRGGLWEPEFSLAADGALVGHWSDETDPAHSQKLVEARTTDGITWTGRRDTVSLPPFGLRPGMPVVRQTTSGTYIMSYEICGASDACGARVRTSTNGWDWGSPTDEGVRPITLDGMNLRHAPTIALSPTPGPNGRAYLIGQLVHAANGQIDSRSNGSRIFVNTEGARGSWYPIAAPVPIPEAFDNFCPNYSSTLLPLDGGKAVLEIASKWDGNVCRPYFARGPLLGSGDDKGVTSGKRYSLISLASGHCLDLVNGSTTSGANIQQWSCNGTPAQDWTPTRSPDGTYTLKVAASSQCLTVAGGSAEPGADVEQRPCDGSSAQAWSIKNVGLDHFVLAHAGTTACLDVAQGSPSPGANVQQWSCNDLAPQIWKLAPR